MCTFEKVCVPVLKWCTASPCLYPLPVWRAAVVPPLCVQATLGLFALLASDQDVLAKVRQSLSVAAAMATPPLPAAAAATPTVAASSAVRGSFDQRVEAKV